MQAAATLRALAASGTRQLVLCTRLSSTIVTSTTHAIQRKQTAAPSLIPLRTVRSLLAQRQQPNRIRAAAIHLSVRHSEDDDKKKRRWPFHMTMTDEQKASKQANIDAANMEKAPPGLIGKFKFYLKRYWYIALPAHMASCSLWFIGLYGVVHSGVDVVGLLSTLHMPEWVLEKVKNTPPAAGTFVVALILYKIVTPLRYLTTLGFIQGIFYTLRRMGRLRTAREVEYKVRSDYEIMKRTFGRRVYRYEGQGVRAFTARKKSEGNVLKSEGQPPKGPEQKT